MTRQVTVTLRGFQKNREIARENDENPYRLHFKVRSQFQEVEICKNSWIHLCQ